jgi:hypothetical protein
MAEHGGDERKPRRIAIGYDGAVAGGGGLGGRPGGDGLAIARTGGEA